VFIPSVQAGHFRQAIVRARLDKAGIKLIGPGDLTGTMPPFPAWADAMLGVVTAHFLFGDASLGAEQGIRKPISEAEQQPCKLHGRERLRWHASDL